MKYYNKISSDKIIKQPKIYDLNYIHECEENNTDNIVAYRYTNLYSIGTPQLCIGKYQWCAIYNPKKSKKTIFLDETSITNFSSSIAIESIYMNPEISYEGLQYMYGKPLSLDLVQNSEGVIIMYQGNIEHLKHNESNSIRLIKPFSTDTTKHAGKISIPPSKSVLFNIAPIEAGNSSSSSYAFSWWEE